jgi:hypothetical protein
MSDDLVFKSFLAESENVEIVHPLLRKWVDGAPVATKLTATLNPEDMREDVWISWLPFSEKTTILASCHGAFIYAVNWGAGLIAATLLSAFAFGPGGENRKIRLAGFVGAAAAAGIVLTAMIYFLLAKTEMRYVLGYRTPRLETLSNLRLVQSAASMETNLTEVRAFIADGSIGPHLQNYLSGGLIREEDSPGNYQLRQCSNHVECVIYDARGAPSSE